MMHRGTIAIPAIMLTALATAGCANTATESGPVTLTFQTLAWQPDLVETNERLVDAWNEANPDVQVKLTRSDWDSVEDQLVTGFEGGTAPDIFHTESEVLASFVERGNILDLTDYLSDTYVEGIRDSAWDSVRFPAIQEGVWGVPFLQELWAVYVDEAALNEAGITPPTAEDPWTWDDYSEVAEALTVDENNDGTPEVYGGGVPLKNPASRILPLASNFGGDFFEIGGDGTVKGIFREQEAGLLTRLEAMLEAGTIPPELLTLSPSNSVTGFIDGQYATFVAPIYLRAAIEEGAPADLDWRMVEPLIGTEATQASVTQALAVNAKTDHPAEAAAFLEFFLNDQNQTDLARGDMLLPASLAASDTLSAETDDWATAVGAAGSLNVLPYQQIRGTQEWIAKVGSPAMETFLSGQTSIDDLKKTLLQEGNEVLARQNR